MKIDRLLGIVMLLLYRRTSTVGELARLFEVSERTIYRDLASLDCSGFPLDSSPGRGGGIGLLPGYRIEERLFSGDSLGILSDTLEALARIIGDTSFSADASLAMGLDRSPVERIVRIDLSNPAMDAQTPMVRRISESIRKSRVLTLLYSDANGSTNRREVEPLRLVLSGSVWYLQAWCRLRTDYRLFRVQRIVECAVTRETFDRAARLCAMPEAKPVLDLPKGEGVVLSIPRPTPAVLQRFGNPPVQECVAGVTATLYWPIDEWLEIWLAGNAPEVIVLEPADLRERVLSRLERAVGAYRPPVTAEKEP